MILALVGLVGLLQAAPGQEPVRVWRADSNAFVTVREAGHLLLLHVDGMGRIQVLYPFTPDDGTSIAGGVSFDVPLPPEAQGNPATLVAIRSRWPFDFRALRMGAAWNYADALLLQPTAGDPLAAVLDIAERVTAGRPYAYGVATYSSDGIAVARGPVREPLVCLSCVRRGIAIAAAPATVATTSVDCSNASLTNSFCGVANANVSITSVPQVAYQPAPSATPATVYVPYYVPIGVVRGEHRRFERPLPLPAPNPPAARPSAAAAFPIAPRLLVPSRAELRSRRP